jgi:hypothetical protein
MKQLVKTVYIICSIIFLIYLALPNPKFPDPPVDSLKSNEPADTETPLRRAYFTNFDRSQVMQNYSGDFEKPLIADISIPSYRLNYPPEEAQTIIRDQTRSTYLEEVVHPFRESVYINGFEPKSAKDTIFIDNREWLQKITVRYVPSSMLARLVVGIGIITIIPAIYIQWRNCLHDLMLVYKKQ